MGDTISISELSNCINKDLGHSEWFQIDQDRINSFANSTDDHQFIHVDIDAAKKSPFGSTIAHGFLTLSLLTALCTDLMLKIDGTVMVLNYGFDKIRFLTPVTVGSRVRAHAKQLDASEKKPGQILMKIAVTIEIDGKDKPALVAEWLSMTIVS